MKSRSTFSKGADGELAASASVSRDFLQKTPSIAPPFAAMPEAQELIKSETSVAEAPHASVLLKEVLAGLEAERGGCFLDATFGAGGYTRALLEACPDTRVLALDRDPEAAERSEAFTATYGQRFAFVATPFSQMEAAAEQVQWRGFDGIVLDIGVSSMQLDQALRGFSFRQDGPLDMRMSQEGESAADIVNHASEARLADIFYHYGEERLARPIARAIVETRRTHPFVTTKQLVDCITKVVYVRPGTIHPATRSFQALRIAVNDELNELGYALHAAERLLKPGGRLVVVSFHSLEDRMVKVFLSARSGQGAGSRYAPVFHAALPSFSLKYKGAQTAGEEELARNVRARSAKLRVGIRSLHPAQPLDSQVMSLAALPAESHPSSRRKKGRKSP